MDIIHGPPIRIEPYFGYRSARRLTISARALRARKPGLEKRGRLRAIRTMIAQFASREESGLEVELELKSPDGLATRHVGTTDKEGFVHFEIDLAPQWSQPEHTRWETVTFHWRNRTGAVCADGYVLVPGSADGLGVISDIDDTIIETGITGGLRSVIRNWRRLLAEMPEERLAVPGVGAFYGTLGGGAAYAGEEGHAGTQLTATHRPFFYVSSSPWNLFAYLVAFMRTRKLPLGPIHLRDWGLNRQTFGSASHGSHKSDAIQGILDFYPDRNFALIGDDTQGDFHAFSEIAVANPGRIAAIFIRTAAGVLTPEMEAARQTIENSGVPLWLGDDYTTGHAFLEASGLEDGEASEIVDTIEKEHARPDQGRDKPPSGDAHGGIFTRS